MRPTSRARILFEIRLEDVDGDSRSAYNELYATSDISQTHSFYLWLLRLLALRPGETYLDVSCGKGQLPALARREGAQAHGVDLSVTALRGGKREQDGLDLSAGNSQHLPYASGRFDVVSNIGSLEHYEDMNAAVREMVRVLKPGGRVLILVPNSFSLLHNVWVALRDGRTHFDEQPIQRYAARREWQELLEQHGLIVHKTLKYEIERPRTRADWWRALRRPKKMLRLFLSPFVPLNLAFCFVFMCHGPDRN